MSLIVNNITSSDIQIEYSYLDTNQCFGYTITANYKINISDIQFEIGNGIIISGRDAIRSAYERQNITARIGGDEFVNGLITNLSFEQSQLVGAEICSVTIVERKRLNDYQNNTFAKHIPSPHFLESFEETYTFDRKESSYNYNRNVSIKYSQDAGNQFLNYAKIFLVNYYHANRPVIGYYEDGISEQARFDKKFYSKLNENIDLIQLSVSIDESFDSSFVDSDDNVSIQRLEKISQDPSGYINKEITLDLTSLRQDCQNTLESAMSNIVDSIILEEQSIYGKPYSISKGITKDSSKGSLTISFSTNPSLSQENSLIYNCSKQKAGSYLQYDLSSTYSSTGSNVKQRFDNTINFWKSSNNQNESKVYALFPEAQGNIYEVSRNTSFSKQSNKISENIVFSTNDAYNTSALPEGIIKYDLTVSQTNKIRRNEKFIDISSLRENLVVSNLYTIGQATVTAVAISEPSYGMFHGKNFLNDDQRTQDMNDMIDQEGSNYYGVSDETTIDLANGTTTRVISYIVA